ncbi:MAG: sigma 54-dependent Fis family transcriptional regulator, partial [Deltaproteobacteria bacterium]|nr:sigma 54-dependent Fis family transcriptional regulator [Deltaproteobacteria bacterium]
MPAKDPFTLPPQDPHTLGAERPVEAKLVVVRGVDEGVEVPLLPQTEVGSDPSGDLVLHDPAVSRRHFVCRLARGRIHVTDSKSRNGTFLGGTRIIEAEVSLGEVLTLGDSSIAIHPRWYLREVQPSRQREFGDLVGESVAMREIFAILQRIADNDVSVLIEGESGTGKELVARSLHTHSKRADRPYVVLDCGAIPHDLAESELFGHKRGSFSGAVADRAGAFQRADGGTLCLDEIGELPLDLQPKLLRVLECGEFRAVGSDVVQTVDVRVVAATNRELQVEAHHGRFREDLLYRLAVVRLTIPPLRKRPEDIPLLIEHLLQGRHTPEDPIEGDNLQRLMSYTWPGNIRELRNTLDRALALAHQPAEQLAFADLVFNLGPAGDSPVTLGVTYPGVVAPMPYKEAKAQLLNSFDRAYLEALLEHNGKNLTRA